MPKTRLSNKERSREILETALKIIYERGFQNLTIRNIASEIGITEAAIYRHFRSKKQIMERLAEWVFKENCFYPEIASKDEFSILEGLMYNQLKKLEDSPYITSILFQEEIFREYPHIRKKFEQHRQKKEQIIKDIVNKGIDQGVIRKDVDAQIFALIFMGCVRMTVLRWINRQFSYSIKEEVKRITRELFKILY